MKPGGCPVASGMPRVSDGKQARGGLGGSERLGHAGNLEFRRKIDAMESGIREVEDNVEATEAWNGPLYEVWIKYRELVADGLREHGENAIRLTPPGVGRPSARHRLRPWRHDDAARRDRR